MERLLPVKEKKGSGTGMGTLMPTCESDPCRLTENVGRAQKDSNYEARDIQTQRTWPDSMVLVYLRATAPEVVKMAVPLPHSLAFTRPIACTHIRDALRNKSESQIKDWAALP